MNRPRRLIKRLLHLGFVLTALTFCACDEGQMIDQPRYEPYEANPFFADGTSARERIPGTVSRSMPLTPPVRPRTDLDLLRHGQERFNIFCTPCHGRDGFGEGIVSQRGYPQPASLHDERLRGAADEHIYTVIENGLGRMPPYSAGTSVRDRWAIVAYVRALQLSQNARLEDVPESHRGSLNSEPATQTRSTHDD